MKTLFQFFKGLSLTLCLSLVLGMFATHTTYAQDELECNCDDYEQTYQEALVEFQLEFTNYTQVLNSNDSGALVEYLATFNLQSAYENLQQASENLQGCQERVEANTNSCLEKPLSQSERGYLSENSGRADLSFYPTVEQLTAFFIGDLSIPDHQEEFELQTDASFQTNMNIVMDFLIEAHNLSGIAGNENIRIALEAAAEAHLKSRGFEKTGDELSKEELDYLRENVGRTFLDTYDTYSKLTDYLAEDLAIEDHQEEFENTFESARDYLFAAHELGGASDQVKLAVYKAIQRYLAGLGIVIQLPDVPCLNCDQEKQDVAAKKAEKAQKQTELATAQTALQNAIDAISQFEQDLTDAINNSCEEVPDYKNVNVQSGQAAGIIMGHHFYCRSEAEVEDMLEALKNFRNSHQKRSDLEDQKNQANRDIKRLNKEIAQLDKDLVKLQAKLANCLKRKNARPECVQPEDQAAEAEANEATGTTGTTGTSGGGRRPTTGGTSTTTETRVETTFVYVPTTAQAAEVFRVTNKSRLQLLHQNFKLRYSSFQNLVNTSGFSDYSRLDTDSKRAIEYLTNRIPLFTGEDGGKRFGEDQLSLRAVVAELLLRLAKLGALEDYDTDISGVARPDDVPAGIWFEESVLAAVKNGVFIPQNNMVRPGDTVNWAELVTILRRFFGLDPIAPETPSFANVSPEEWYTAEFETLIQSGILTRGEFAVTVRPWEFPTKVQMARLIYNTLGDQASFIEAGVSGEFNAEIGDVNTVNLNNKSLNQVTLADVSSGTINAAGEVVVPFSITPTNTNTPTYGNLIELVTDSGLLDGNHGVIIRTSDGGVFDSERRTNGQRLNLQLVIANANSLFQDGKGGIVEFTVTNEADQVVTIQLQVGVQE